MRQVALKVVLGLLAICVLGTGLIAVLVPPLVNSDEFHATLRERLSDALGTPVEWEGLDFGILPLRLMVVQPILLASTGNSEDARVTAESVDLRLDLLPLFVGRIQIESLVLRGVDLVVTRMPDGFILPVSLPGAASGETIGDDVGAAEEGSPNETAGLDIRRIVISDSRVLIRDRISSQPVDWRFENLEFGAQAGDEKGLLVVEFSADLHSGSTRLGRLMTTGAVTLAGRYDLEFEIEQWSLAKILPPAWEPTATGTLSGRVSLVGEMSTVSKLAFDLRVDELGLRGTDLDLRSEGEASLVGALTLEDDDRIGVEVGLELADGARVDLAGSVTLAGALDLRAELESFDLALVAPFLPDPSMELAGRATGDGSWQGDAGSPDVIQFDLAVTAGRVRTPDYRVEGPFRVRVEVKDPLSGRPHGRIEVDLTSARLEYGGQFEKPVGMRAEMTADFVTEESGEIQYESRIRFRDIDEILLQGSIGDSLSFALTSPNFDLEGLGEVFPALAPFHLDGIASFDTLGFELGDGAPDRFRGRIELKDVGFEWVGADRVEIRGAIVAEGESILADGIRLRVGTMTIGIDGMLEDPFDAARFDVRVRSIGPAEVNDLLTAFTSNSNLLFGPLEFAGAFAGVASSEADLYRSLVGRLEFTIGKDEGGRLRGVSILKTVLDAMPLLGGAAFFTRPFRSGRSVEDYFTDRFEILEGDFEVADGKVNAKTLRMVYEGYEATLTGPIRLRDLSIDMTGEVLLKGDLVSAVSGFAGARLENRKPIRIPLANVTNTLFDPKIRITPKILLAVPKLLLQGTGLDKIAIGIGKSLGLLVGDDEE